MSKRNRFARGLCAMVAIAIVWMLIWCSGVVINGRGPELLIAVGVTLAAFIVGITCPLFDKP